MTNYQYQQDPSYRIVNFVRNRVQTLREKEPKKLGRHSPVIPRKSERLTLRDVDSARSNFNLMVGMIIINFENDFVVSENIKTLIWKADKNKFEGHWQIFKEFLDYFFNRNDEVSHRHLTVTYEAKIEPNYKDPVDFAEFLLEHFHTDEIFGNILPSASKLYMSCRIISDRNYVDLRPVNEPQRKRGYNDKGALPKDLKGRNPQKGRIRIVKEGYEGDTRKHLEDWNIVTWGLPDPGD